MWDAVYELMLASRLTHKHHAMFGTNTSRPNMWLYTTKKKNDLLAKIVLVGLPGFEPRMTGPESVVLPLHHSPLFVFDGAKVEHFFLIAKKIWIFFHIFVKIFLTQ